MRSLEDMRAWLIGQTRNKSVRQLAREIGLDHSTLHRIIDGTITDSRLSTLVLLDEAMNKTDVEMICLEDKEYVAIIKDDTNKSFQVHTNIEKKEEVLALMTAVLCKIEANIRFTRSEMTEFLDFINQYSQN